MKDLLLKLGHSPDPDDAFMFYALAQDPPLVPTGRYRFKHVLQDIQTLNDRVMMGELEITAISIHAYPHVADKYALTSCGSSMGDKYGPMVVAREPMRKEDLPGKIIAIPGELTTAFLTLQLCIGRGAPDAKDFGLHRDDTHPHKEAAFHFHVIPFDVIPNYVKSGKADAGLIIHEGQLTYEQLGLHMVVDLGAWWHERTDLPLPLGGNAIRKDLGAQTMQEVTNILKASIQYSLDHRAQAVDYALRFGRDLDRELADKFVGMYVNQWTLDYGERGREAISRLLKQGSDAGLVPPIDKIDFINAT